jgi:glycosyltransferase involved in cell wall biosynthesis
MGIIEAMACGLPVVAFDCLWGPRSIITDGEDGFLVENGNIEKLAETILSLMNYPEKISEMGINARKNVQRFNIDTIAKKWKRLFDSL